MIDTKSLYGKKMGELTFLEDLGIRDNQHKILCVCDCGMKATPKFYNWKTGSSKTCGTKNHWAQIGKKRGKLIVIGVNKTENETMLECRCKCGNEVVYTLDEFLKSTNCGECEPKKKTKAPKREIIIGEKFNLLTVEEDLGHIYRGRRTVKCKCDCGKEITTLFEYLVDGRVKSCGCKRKKDDKWKNVCTEYKISGINWSNTDNRWIVRETLGNGKRKYHGAYKKIEEAFIIADNVKRPIKRLVGV